MIPRFWTLAEDGLLARRLGPWAREKLYYVERYIEIFNKGMRHKWPLRSYIDLFSGPGIVVAQQQEIPGSPLLAVKSQVPFTDTFLNDLEALAVESLRARYLAFGIGTRARFLTLDCNEAATAIRDLLPVRSLDLAFIDPTNWQITFDSIGRLTDGRPMDLIITFHIGGMKRAAQSAPTSLDAFFGTPKWRTAYEQSRRAGRREGSRILLDCYEEQLRTLGYRWTGDAVRVTNSQHLGLYHLLFASKNERGEDFWKKISGRSPSGQLPLLREALAPYSA